MLDRLLRWPAADRVYVQVVLLVKNAPGVIDSKRQKLVDAGIIDENVEPFRTLFFASAKEPLNVLGLGNVRPAPRPRLPVFFG